MGRMSDLYLEQQYENWLDRMSYDEEDSRLYGWDDSLFCDWKVGRATRTTDFYIKAVGVTYGNRQSVIKTLRVGDVLHFVPEENNPYDKNAVLIVTESGKDIGYVSKDYNREILQNIKNGVIYKLMVSNVTGACDINYNMGVNIKVSVLNNPSISVTKQHHETKEYIINNGVLERYVGNSKTVVIPDEVTIIGKGAFEGCTSVEELVFPAKLKVIRASAFWNCQSLKEIKFPNSLQNIGIVAFGQCNSLITVCVPKNVSIIGERVFQNCKNLKEAKILSDVVEIGCTPFLGCNNLKTIVFSESVKEYFRRHKSCPKCGGTLYGFIFKECLDCEQAGRF